MPDAVQGRPFPPGTLLTTIPKIGGPLGAYRLLTAVSDHVVEGGCPSRSSPRPARRWATSPPSPRPTPRRLLAYSTIGQVGYLLMAVAVAGRADRALPGLPVYLIGYAVTNLAGFAVLAAGPHDTLLSGHSPSAGASCSTAP